MSNSVQFLISHAKKAYKSPQQAANVYRQLAKVLQKSFPHRARVYQVAAELLQKENT